MRVVVTGAPGWLGTRLVHALVDQGREVTCLVHPSADVGSLPARGVTLHTGDVTRPDSLRGLCSGAHTVMHCAAAVHPRRVDEMWRVNLHGTVHVLDRATCEGVRRFIHVSTSAVAGPCRSPTTPWSEADRPRPYGEYGRSKLAAEMRVTRAHRRGDLSTTILRPCWFYGEGQPERQTAFMRMIAGGTPIMFGSGRNRRSLTYVDDLVDAMIAAEASDRARGRTYWIADERPYTVDEIYGTIARVLGVADLRPRRVPLGACRLCELASSAVQRAGWHVKELRVAAEMGRDVACSTDRAREELGFRPRGDIEEGMRRSVEWCTRHGVHVR